MIERFIVSLLLLLITMVQPAFADIEWELKFPFRMFDVPRNAADYFRDDVDLSNWHYRRQFYVYGLESGQGRHCLDSQRPILCSEMRLGPRRRALAESLLGEVPGAQIPLHGSRDANGLSNLRLAVPFLQLDDFYDEANFRHRGAFDARESYNPEHHLLQPLPETERPAGGEVNTRRITARLSGNEYSDFQCIWRVERVEETTQPCSDDLDSVFVRGEASSIISVRVLDGAGETVATFEKSDRDTLIQERVILSLGDSYSSGEGAPDFGARTRFSFPDELSSGPSEARQVRLATVERIAANGADAPEAVNSAQWMERDCHRSFLAAPSRAAIHYAAMNPRVEVIHINLACSGAEVYDGILGTYSRSLETSGFRRERERVLPPNEDSQLWRTTLSQLNQSILLLCENPDIESYKQSFNAYFESDFSDKSDEDIESIRDYWEVNRRLPHEEPYMGMIDCLDDQLVFDVDLLTLTIGGNDFNFIPILMNAMVSEAERRAMNRLFPGRLAAPEPAGNAASEGIPQLFAELTENLVGELHIQPHTILVSAYPIGTRDEERNFCDSSEGLLKMDIARILLDPNIDAGESEAITTQFAGRLNGAISDAARQQGWSFVDAGNLFDSNGWCARRTAGGRTERHGIVHEHYSDNGLSNREVNGYAVTGRWVRTPDDGAAVQNQLPEGYEWERDSRFNRLLVAYGFFHPNGLGAAAWGDLYYRCMVAHFADSVTDRCSAPLQ
ncbi:MAG: hypothetical protein AAF234_08200 [Pseudomonadota bacterium]